jgi:RNA polymerase sigma-70 factor, ECF subfamily
MAITAERQSSAGPAAEAQRVATERAPRPMDEDDFLLDRIADGDQQAFRHLVERHIDRAYALALRILRNATDAEDVAQDVMLKVWTARGTWRNGHARFSTWLYRVVTNRCLDLYRRPRTENIDEVPESIDYAPDAVAGIHRTEVGLLLDKAMARLPEQQRIAIILSYTDELKNAEIAEIMDVSVMAVESLLKRGRQQLRHLMRNSEAAVRALFTGD